MDDLHIEYESTPAAWCAYFDPEGYIGRGKTREEAITELLEYAYEAWGAAVDERNAAKRSLSDSIKSRDAYWQERFSDALQSDLEHGVQALSAHAAIQFNTTYPALLATLVALREATE